MGTDIFSVLRLLAKGDVASALDKLLEANPMPGVTGRLAPEPFAETQVYNRKGERISLRAIERFLGDHARSKAMIDKPSGIRQRVVIVGSGPTGLSAAFVLIRAGYRVTVLEASHVLGGRLSYVYPEFRLPSQVVASLGAQLKASGVEFVTSAILGRNIALDEVWDKDTHAVLLACGGGVAKTLGIPGEEAAGVISVEDFLKARHWMKAGIEPYTTPLDVGKKVVIAGANEEAFHAASILVRLGRAVTIAVDGSETRMGVEAALSRQASEEGVKFRTFARPKKVVFDTAGCVRGLACDHMDYRVDAKGHLNMVAEEDGEFILEADTLITAAGAEANTLFLKDIPGMVLGAEGVVTSIGGGSATPLRKVFAAGRVVDPSLSLLAAVVAGKKAAGEIAAFLAV